MNIKPNVNANLLAEVQRLRAILYDYFICPECGQKKCDGECEEE